VKITDTNKFFLINIEQQNWSIPVEENTDVQTYLLLGSTTPKTQQQKRGAKEREPS
jgi:hypothetical protein